MNEQQIETLIRSEMHNPETALRRWISDYQRLRQLSEVNKTQIADLEADLEVMGDLLKVTISLLETHMGDDTDMEVVSRLASEWRSKASQELH